MFEEKDYLSQFAYQVGEAHLKMLYIPRYSN